MTSDAAKAAYPDGGLLGTVESLREAYDRGAREKAAEYDRHAMVLAGLANLELIDHTQSRAKVDEQVVRAYLWAVNNAEDLGDGVIRYPSLTALREAWPSIIGAGS